MGSHSISVPNPNPFASKPGCDGVLPQVPVEKENRRFRLLPGIHTGWPLDFLMAALVILR